MARSTPARATAVVAGLFLLGLSAGAWVGAAAVARAQDPYAGLQLFARVLTTIETDYVDEVSPDLLVEAAIRGMTDELDRHSRWLSQDEFHTLQDETEGSYEGIGVEVRRVDRGVLVSHVVPGSPASRDGLEADDVIVAVNGERLEGLPLDQVSEILQGPRGEAVLLTVERPDWDQPREVRTVRDRVHVSSVEGALLEGDVAYVRIVQFQKGAALELEGELEHLGSEVVLSGLVLDLRDNPGGLLDEAVGVSDLFLDQGTIVSTRGRVEGTFEHRATAGGVDPDLRVAILINGQSASASEIVAGALQDTGRAVLVGTNTYGKGSVQTLYRNRDDSALKLTIGRYYTPSGEPVAERDGRAPDERVPYPGDPTAAELLRDRIAGLEVPEDERDYLLELVDRLPAQEREESAVPWSVPAEERVALDPQLRAALELVRGR